MAQVHWLRAANGAFNTAADWSTGVVPGASDDAILDASGSVFTVSATQNATVNSVQTASNALLDIQADFSVTSGTGAGANNGAIRIENGHALTLQGTVTNVGTMELFGTVSTTSIVLGSGGVTLTGGGDIFLNFTGGKLQQIVPSASGSVLTDVDNRISGQGLLGGPGLTIIVGTQGFLEAKAGPLIIDTGAHSIVNAGLIDAEGAPGSDGLPPGIGTVKSPVDNSGIVESGGVGSILTFEGAVTGAGRAIVHDGTLAFDAFFSQNVDFEGTTGVLALGQSVNYTGLIAQFSTTGSESFDLGDIAFVGAGEATYSGTTSGGTLTVTDGSHTARIRLEGNYLGEAFIASSDGHGGTSITDQAKALHWLNPVNGSFSTAADWTAGRVPAAQNDAVLDAPGSTPYTVTASGSLTVLGVQTAASATLAVAGVFNATSGTDGGVSAGKITVATGGVLKMAGAIANIGTISLASSGAATYLGIGANTTLSGGGTVSLVGSNAKEDVIYGLDSTCSLTNVDNTIAGAGDLGEGRLILINQAAGVINANATGGLVLDTGTNTVTNAGLIEATGSGGLSILSAVNNAGGGVIAAAGGKVYLEGADILGGTLRTSGGKFIYVASGVDTLEGTISPVTVQGEVVVENAQTLNLAGSIANSGLVVLVSDGAATTLAVGGAGATLSGGGQVFMTKAADEIIGAGAASTLDNLSHIAGTGNVGGGRMTLINGAAGVIVGEGSVAALVVDTGANAIVNAGRIENTGKGGTLVKSAVNNSGAFVAEGGTLTVTGAVTGSGVGVIYAGTLAFASSFSQTVAFRGPSGVLGLAQSQGFAATISGFSATGGTSLDLGDIAFKSAGEATYSGTATSGVLTVTDGVHTAHIHLTGNYLASAFTASSDGHGGTIITDSHPTAIDWLNPVSGSFQTAQDWAGGVVPGPGDDAILDASGATNYTVTASANQTVEELQTGAGATLAISAGMFTANHGSGSGVNGGTISVADGATFSVSGTLDNTGVLYLQGTNKGADVRIGPAGLSLTGGGEFILASSLTAPFQPCPPSLSIDYVYGVSGATLTNVDNTIVGAGYIGLEDDLVLVNEAKGVIDASLDTDLVLRTSSTMNGGLLEATGAGGLYIERQTVDNSSGGVIAANGGIVYISYSEIIGGTLTASGAGYIYYDWGPSMLDGSTAGPVTNQAFVFISSGATLTIDGVIDNLNEIEAGVSAKPSSLIIGSGGATLTGGGKVFLEGSSPDTQITGATAGATLTNVDNTIYGQGQIGAGSLILINEAGGVIDANNRLGLTIDTGANTVANAGLIETTGVGALTIRSAVNNDGALEANGGLLQVEGAVTGGGGAVIVAGTLRFDSSFNQNVTFEGSRGVLSLAQSVSYTGLIAGFSATGGESLDLGDIGFVGAGEATYSGTTSGGMLTVTDGAHTATIQLTGDYTAATFSANSDGGGGTIVTDGSPTAIHWLSAVSGSFQTAADWRGGVAPGPGNDVFLDASGATHYTVTTSTSQSVGAIQTAANATLVVTGSFTAANNAGAGSVNAGTIDVGNGGTLTVGGALGNTGRITLGASSGRTSLKVAGALTLTGGGEVFMGDNVGNFIVGSSASATLTNVQNTIAGAGYLGGGELTLINGAAGKIVAEGQSTQLFVDTGANTILNAGLIEAAGVGATIASPVENAGYLKADGGNLTVNGAVTGTGSAVISGGTLRFNAAFNQNVAFQGASGVLALAQSVNYAGTIHGFSTTGSESLDLGDIAFVSAGEATFSGTATSGVLTVTDGVHTAHIHLTGNYLASAFTASSDGNGGTMVVDPTTAAATAAHRFIAAAAALGAKAVGTASLSHDSVRAPPPILARPGVMMA